MRYSTATPWRVSLCNADASALPGSPHYKAIADLDALGAVFTGSLGFVDILEHSPTFLQIRNAGPVLEGLGKGFEIHNISAILLPRDRPRYSVR